MVVVVGHTPHIMGQVECSRAIGKPGTSFVQNVSSINLQSNLSAMPLHSSDGISGSGAGVVVVVTAGSMAASVVVIGAVTSHPAHGYPIPYIR